MILVTGATGNVGSELTRTLAARGEDVRVLTRHPDKAAFPSGVQVGAGDLQEPETLSLRSPASARCSCSAASPPPAPCGASAAKEPVTSCCSPPGASSAGTRRTPSRGCGWTPRPPSVTPAWNGRSCGRADFSPTLFAGSPSCGAATSCGRPGPPCPSPPSTPPTSRPWRRSRSRGPVTEARR
jgi:hypothetical protein